MGELRFGALPGPAAARDQAAAARHVVAHSVCAVRDLLQEELATMELLGLYKQRYRGSYAAGHGLPRGRLQEAFRPPPPWPSHPHHGSDGGGAEAEEARAAEEQEGGSQEVACGGGSQGSLNMSQGSIDWGLVDFEAVMAQAVPHAATAAVPTVS